MDNLYVNMWLKQEKINDGLLLVTGSFTLHEFCGLSTFSKRKLDTVIDKCRKDIYFYNIENTVYFTKTNRF